MAARNPPRRFGDAKSYVDWGNPMNTDTLKTMWLEGKPASQIAAVIGCTRNSIIGKIHRMGLTRSRMEPKVPILEPVKAEKVVKVAEVVEPPPPPPIEELFPVTYDRVTFLDLAPRHCRYIADEPDGFDTLYCGATKVRGQSWCAEHLKLTGGNRHEPKATDGRFKKSVRIGVYQ